MATVASIMAEAAATRRETDLYHTRYGRWINGIMDTFKQHLAALEECVQLADRSLAAGIQLSQAQLDGLQEALIQAKLSAKNSANPQQAQHIVNSFDDIIRGYTKPQGARGLPAGRPVPNLTAAEWAALGGWRPTKKISARKTRTHSKKNKTNTKSNTKSKNTVKPIGGYRNRRRMMR